MNVSPSNRERKVSAARAKDTNPDVSPAPRGNGHGSPSNIATGASPSTRARPGADARQGRTDEQLLEAYRFGEKTSFNQLVDRYHRELFHFLVRFLGDRAAAEDV